MFAYRFFLRVSCVLALSMAFVGWSQGSSRPLAATPPMGWNSWDAYGLTITEAQFRRNVTVLAGMRALGWKYAVIDEGWYMRDPMASGAAAQHFVLDGHGRLIPAPGRFPSAAGGAGLKPIADWVHAQGLLFGIHLVRGIPRESVRRNLPIAGSQFTAAEAGDVSDVCPWDDGNYGVRDNAAGQAWYDSMISLYASWGVDFLKVDCISDHPYKPTEIRQIAAAIKKTGRPIVLSLSPGPTALSHAAEVAKYAQMWRISDDHWDVWSHVPQAGKGEFPLGTRQAFDRLAEWNKWAGAGHWPDEDMLPFGDLEPHPGWGKPRESRLTHDEERTEFTLWAVARSPLILGANLTKLDAFTRGLVRDRLLIALNQQGNGAPVSALPAEWTNLRCWESTIASGRFAGRYLVLFNVGDEQQSVRLDASAMRTLAPGTTRVREMGTGRAWSAKTGGSIALPAHGSAVLRLESGSMQ